MIDKIDLSKELIAFIDDSPCSYLATETMGRILEENGFREYDLTQELNLKKGDKGYIVNNDSAIIAFNIFDEKLEEKGFKIIGSHSDSPGFRIKSNPIMQSGNVLKLNTEVYGGPIIPTWLDRVLSISGRVSIKGDSPFHPVVKTIKIDRDLMTIPNIAIHMNRDLNKGFEYNPQIHTLPILSLDESKKLDKELLDELISDELNVEVEDIIDYDLYLFDRSPGRIIGLHDELISAGRLDDLGMVYTSLKAFMDTKGSGINIFISTDNEEVGSGTIQGADSPMISETLERIAIGLGKDREELLMAIENSFMISADMSHAVHPNFDEKADPTNRPKMGDGPVIKYAANKSYTTDAYSASVFKGLCDEAGVEFQEFYNRSDKRGGSTIGPITTGHLNVKAVDIGNAILGMHSIRELGSVDDILDIYKVFKEFYR